MILFNHYHSYIFTVALKLLNNASQAEEVVQDVFLKIWLKREMLPEVEVFAAFLYKVAENIIYPALRQQAVKIRNEEFFKLNNSHNTAHPDSFLTKEYTEILHHAVKQLPSKQKQTYILIKEEGLKREQVAAHLKVSPETVKSNLDEAMKNIRAYCLARIGMNMVLLANFLLSLKIIFKSYPHLLF